MEVLTEDHAYPSRYLAHFCMSKLYLQEQASDPGKMVCQVKTMKRRHKDTTTAVV